MQVSKCEFDHVITQVTRSERGINDDGSCETTYYFNRQGDEIAVEVMYYRSGESAYFVPHLHGHSPTVITAWGPRMGQPLQPQRRA